MLALTPCDGWILDGDVRGVVDERAVGEWRRGVAVGARRAVGDGVGAATAPGVGEGLRAVGPGVGRNM